VKIYTKTGDEGETGLFAGPRVPKDDARIEAYGTVDELNSVLGMVRNESLDEALDLLILNLQKRLFTIGAELATPEPQMVGLATIGDQDVVALEAEIDRYDDELPPLKAFIIPGGTHAARALHLARAICRRAERRVVTLTGTAGKTAVSPTIVRYLNRLSDLLFVLSRVANHRAGVTDVQWSGKH
jgi:cob(I)alamin adenosyltransferase